MFILRRVTSEDREVNTCLGKSYILVLKNDNKEEFYRAYKAYLKEDPDQISEEFKNSVENDVFGFIVYENGSEFEVLYKKSFYYVMTESGKTFARLQ